MVDNYKRSISIIHIYYVIQDIEFYTFRMGNGCLLSDIPVPS